MNTHQDKPILTDTEWTGRLQLAVDTRKTLGKRPPHHQRLPGPHTCSPPPKKRHTERTSSDEAYPSLIPQVDYTEEPTPDNPSKPCRTLLQIPTHNYIPSSTPPTKRPAPDHTKHPPHTVTRVVRSPKEARTEEASHTRKHPPEVDPRCTSKRQKWLSPPETGHDKRPKPPTTYHG